MKITLVVIVGLAALLWIIGNLFTYVFQGRLIMQPSTLKKDRQYFFDTPFEEVFLQASDDGMINALHFKASTDPVKGVILYFHGNAGNLWQWGEINTDFIRHGYDLFILDYRGFGKSTGKLSPKALYGDAKLAYDYLCKSYKPENIIIYGRSLGSAPATRLAAQVKAKRLILETPFYSMKDLSYMYFPFLPKIFLFKYPMRNDKYIQQVNCPVTIFHGTDDQVVPYQCSIKLKDHLKKGDQYITIEGGAHNDLNVFETYQKALTKTLTE